MKIIIPIVMLCYKTNSLHAQKFTIAGLLTTPLRLIKGLR